MATGDRYLIDDLAGAVAGVYREGERALVELVTGYLERGLDAPDWATRRMLEARALARAAQLVVDALQRDGSAALREAVARAYGTGAGAAVVDLADRVAGDVGHLARAAADRHGPAALALARAAVDDLRPVHEAVLRQTVDAYRRAVAGATARTLTGRVDTRHAAQSAWAALVDRGITGFVDRSGRHWRLHSYVEMAARSAIARAMADGVAAATLAAGRRLVYVTDTAGECERCRPWEHKVLALVGLSGVTREPDERRGYGRVRVEVAGTLAQAREAGLLHPNCHHEIRPYLPGRTRLSPARPDPAGNAARVRQRELERHVRRWREREAAALTPEARAVARARVRSWDAALGAHVERAGLRRLRYREMPGAGYTAPPQRRHRRADLPAAPRRF